MNIPSPGQPVTSTARLRPIFVSHSHLVVRDLDRIAGFYEMVIGLKVIERHASGVVLGVEGRPLLTLSTRGDAEIAPRKAAGLFHHAFLVPDRTALAHWLAHAIDHQVPLEGASDHLVSEAIYLSDPEGNGIEIYADRPVADWRYRQDGGVEMATLGLDLRALYAGATRTPFAGMAPGTVLGHIHLQVGQVQKADDFYRDVLGLAIMARYPGASFFGAGGYHHHVAANIWNSRGAGPRAEAMTGLSGFSLGFNDPAARAQALSAAEGLEIAVARTAEGQLLRDPWGIAVTLLD